MSDFGSMVTVRRSDGAKLVAENHASVEEAIRVIQTEMTPDNAVGEPLVFRLVDSDQNLVIILSEYWLEGIDEGFYDLSVEQILEAEHPKAQLVQTKLVQALGADYQIEAMCGMW